MTQTNVLNVGTLKEELVDELNNNFGDINLPSRDELGRSAQYYFGDFYPREDEFGPLNGPAGCNCYGINCAKNISVINTVPVKNKINISKGEDYYYQETGILHNDKIGLEKADFANVYKSAQQYCVNNSISENKRMSAIGEKSSLDRIDNHMILLVTDNEKTFTTSNPLSPVSTYTTKRVTQRLCDSSIRIDADWHHAVYADGITGHRCRLFFNVTNIESGGKCYIGLLEQYYTFLTVTELKVYNTRAELDSIAENEIGVFYDKLNNVVKMKANKYKYTINGDVTKDSRLVQEHGNKVNYTIIFLEQIVNFDITVRPVRLTEEHVTNDSPRTADAYIQSDDPVFYGSTILTEGVLLDTTSDIVILPNDSTIYDFVLYSPSARYPSEEILTFPYGYGPDEIATIPRRYVSNIVGFYRGAQFLRFKLYGDSLLGATTLVNGPDWNAVAWVYCNDVGGTSSPTTSPFGLSTGLNMNFFNPCVTCPLRNSPESIQGSYKVFNGMVVSHELCHVVQYANQGLTMRVNSLTHPCPIVNYFRDFENNNDEHDEHDHDIKGRPEPLLHEYLKSKGINYKPNNDPNKYNKLNKNNKNNELISEIRGYVGLERQATSCEKQNDYNCSNTSTGFRYYSCYTTNYYLLNGQDPTAVSPSVTHDYTPFFHYIESKLNDKYIENNGKDPEHRLLESYLFSYTYNKDVKLYTELGVFLPSEQRVSCAEKLKKIIEISHQVFNPFFYVNYQRVWNEIAGFNAYDILNAAWQDIGGYNQELKHYYHEMAIAVIMCYNKNDRFDIPSEYKFDYSTLEFEKDNGGDFARLPENEQLTRVNTYLKDVLKDLPEDWADTISFEDKAQLCKDNLNVIFGRHYNDNIHKFRYNKCRFYDSTPLGFLQYSDLIQSDELIPIPINSYGTRSIMNYIYSPLDGLSFTEHFVNKLTINFSAPDNAGLKVSIFKYNSKTDANIQLINPNGSDLEELGKDSNFEIRTIYLDNGYKDMDNEITITDDDETKDIYYVVITLISDLGVDGEVRINPHLVESRQLPPPTS